jgi:hypothetical protein
MSKLTDRIRRATRVEAAPLGFAAAAARTRTPTQLLGVLVVADAANAIAAARDAGADFYLVKGAAQPGGVPDVPEGVSVGVWPADFGTEGIEAAKSAGADFVVIDLDHTPASVLLDDSVGHVLLAPGDLEDTLLRAVEALPIDAVLLSDGPGNLTIRRQLELRRLHGLTQKPLLMVAPPTLSEQELLALRDIGVVGVVVDTKEKGSAGQLSALRATIDNLPARRRRREEAPTPILPRAPMASEAQEEQEDE